MKKVNHKYAEIWETVKNKKKVYAVQYFNRIGYYDTYDKAKDMSDMAIDVMYDRTSFEPDN